MELQRSQKGVGDEDRGSSLVEALAQVADPRSRHGRRYALAALLSLAVYAMLCGARSLAAMAQWGRDQGEPVAQALGFPRGRTPCVATLHLLFRRLDREAFEGRLGQWLWAQALPEGSAPAAVALDGKSLRGIHGEEVPGVHLVAAYAHTRGVVLGQQGGRRGTELPTAWVLLEWLPLEGRVVTGDAQFTQREVCQEVVQKGGTTSSW